MIIPKVLTYNSTFKGLKWDYNTRQVLSEKECAILKAADTELRKRQAQRLEIVGHVIERPEKGPEHMRVYFVTMPTDADMKVIRNQPRHYGAPAEEYRRKSKPMFIDENFANNAKAFMDRQIGYIMACKKDPNHSSSVIIKKRK